MNTKNKHINFIHSKIPGILLKTLVVFGLMYVFIQPGTVKAQVINNENAVISVTSGTAVQGDTIRNTAGTLINEGIINLKGSYINADSTKGNGNYNIKGNWLNTGKFVPGNSIVRFNGNNIQTITSGGDTIYHLIIDNTSLGLTNRIRLLDNARVRGTLTLDSGIVEAGTHTLFLLNQASNALDYTSTTNSRVIGKFERGVNATDKYLFPLGSDDHYNPMNLTFHDVTTGSVLSEFVATDPDSIGLPLPDPGYVNPADTVEVYDADSTGYWSVTAKNFFASTNFDVNLDGPGFETPFQNATRIIKRPSGGDWTLDGDHLDAVGSVTYRNTLIGGVDNSGHHFGWGKIRPRIQTQPADTAICDGESATFSVVATGRGGLSYVWQVLEGSGGWQNIDNTYDAISIYANYETDTLLIIGADTSMNGYKYRVIITDSLGNFKRSNSQATLTVNPRPVAIATPQNDTICNGEETFIDLNSTVAGTTFDLQVLYDGSGFGATTTITNDTTIRQTLINGTLNADSVVYRIVPTGPGTTSCLGTADTVVIWVEPTVEINAVNDTICDGTSTNITVTSPNITTNGIRFTWTVVDNGQVTGESNSTGDGQDIGTSISQNLTNNSQVAQLVQYTITPWTVNASDNNECTDPAEEITIDIWLEPTVEITAANDTLCDGDFTNITVSSPNTTTNGIRYTWTFIDNTEVTGETASSGNGQVIGTPISHNLVNTSYEKQLVQYVITPWTVNANNENECTDAAEEITIDIWVDPTPVVFTSIAADTICNDTRTSITLTTPNVMTAGEVTFDYTSTSDAGLSGNGGNTNRTDSYIIADSLHNSTTYPAISPQVARYTITPRTIATGCADGADVVDSITVHPTAYTEFNPVDSVRCYGESNGSANVVARNGINDFTFAWNDALNQTDSTATGLSQGEYIVTVTDNQSCIKIDTVLIEEPDLLVPVVDTVRNVSCFGIGDGYVIMEPTGGNGAYSYDWKDHPEGTDSLGGLSGGNYYVTVTDWKGCTDNTYAFVNEPPQTSVEVIDDDVRCYGEHNGRAEALAPGFTQFVWNTGDSTNVIDSLAPGTYTVIASNPEGCIKIGSATIKEPDPMVVDSIESTIISCEGDADGTISMNILGGNISSIQPFTYSWSTLDGSGIVAADSAYQTGLSGGTYQVTVTDWRGCSVDTSAIVYEPGPYFSDVNVTDVTCFNDGDGAIDLIITGGNNEEPYEFIWSTSNGNGLDQDVEDQSGLSGGSYYVTVIDAKDCEIYDTATIFEPDLLEADITSTNSSCFGYEDGTASVDITGGNGGFSVTWSPGGENTDSIFGLSSGTYAVQVIDSKGCVTSNELEITEPEQINNNVVAENITCFGDANGQITISPEGGTVPYTYQWSHSGTFSDSLANNLDPGSYVVSVVDQNNCLEVSTIELTQPDPLTLTANTEDITCYGFNDGYINLSMFGGTPEYSYDWSNGLNTSSADQLTPGIYQINISDIHNCEIDTSFTIEEPDELIITPSVVRPTCPDIRDGSIELNITGGRTPYTIYWDDGYHEENLYEIRSGIYEVLVIDSSLCEVDSAFVVRSAFDDCLDIPTAFTPNNDGTNDLWEIDMQGLYPEAEVQVFDRWGQLVFFSNGYEESQYWDGSYNGKQLPMDAYYYIIYLKNGAQRISGTVTIIR